MRNLIDLMCIYVSKYVCVCVRVCMFVCWLLLYANVQCMYRFARVYIISVCVCHVQVSEFLPRME